MLGQIRSVVSRLNPQSWHLPINQRTNYLRGLVFISPWLLGFLLLQLAPILASLYYSFTNFYLLTPDLSKFTGLTNYREIVKDPQVWRVLGQTILQALEIIPVQVVASILLAALLNRKKLWLKNTVRALFFVPSIVPSVAAVYMWQGFVNPKNGWLTKVILAPFGLESWNHLSGRGMAPTLTLINSLWAIGPGFLIILGVMQSISPDILEAALIDGAGRLRRFFSITLPLTTPAIFFMIFINLTATFTGVMIMDRGRSFQSNVSSYDNFIYLNLFGMSRLGYASGLAWVFFVIVMAIVLLLFLSSKFWVYFPDREHQA